MARRRHHHRTEPVSHRSSLLAKRWKMFLAPPHLLITAHTASMKVRASPGVPQASLQVRAAPGVPQASKTVRAASGVLQGFPSLQG